MKSKLFTFAFLIFTCFVLKTNAQTTGNLSFTFNQCYGEGAELKFDLEPEPFYWVGFGSFFWPVKNETIKDVNFFNS